MEYKSDPSSFWKWKGCNFNKKNEENQFPITKFFQQNRRKVEEKVLGPGGGAGIGCGVGLGFGLVGGVGFGGSTWNNLHLVFGFGLGCGVGLGLGFGQGIGYGFSLDSLETYFPEQKSDSKDKGLLIQI